MSNFNASVDARLYAPRDKHPIILNTFSLNIITEIGIINSNYADNNL